MVVLLVETGLFHGVMRKAFQGPMCRKMRYSAKIYLNRNKRLYPGARCLIHNQVAQFHPAMEEV